MKNICVFCGSNLGKNGNYVKAAERLGEVLVQENLNLIYGGANVGLMRIIAKKVLEGNKHVTGVITHHLAQKHLTLPNLSELITVETMQQRKAKMAELADGFITLPGGIGSMEEIFEVLTAAQLGFHGKPIGLLNVDGYYDYLIKFMDHMIHEEFLIPAHGSLIIHDTDPKNLLEKMRKFEPPKVGKWIEKIIEKNKLADETSN